MGLGRVRVVVMSGSEKRKKEIDDLGATGATPGTSLEGLPANHTQDIQLLRRRVAHLASGQASNPEAILARRVYTEIPAEKASDFISETPELVILDVRTEGEWRYGHISNSIHIDIHGFESRVHELPKDRSRPIICFCAHGVRSAVACQILAELGYGSLYNVDGGMSRYTGEIVVQ